MSTNLPPTVSDLRPRITVIGVGGAGCNAVNNMIDANLQGVDFVVANTDAQALAVSHAGLKVQLGVKLTEGLGAGSRPEIGEAAAEEALDDIRGVVAGSHMVFVAAGMGGGTGTGAAAVIARTAKQMGILTVAVVTKPFQFEGTRRMRIAEAGIAELRQYVDTLIVIPNQNLFRIASDRTTFAEAFVLADQVLYSGVACIVDLIVKEGLINLDFADVRTVMSGMGTAMMGTGESAGERRAIRAAEEAISNPLLDDVTLQGAKGLLLSITGGANLTLYEVDEAASRVRQEVDPDANIIVGATFDDSLGDRVRVSIVASGMARLAQSDPGFAAAALGQPAPGRAAPPVTTPSPIPMPDAAPPHMSSAPSAAYQGPAAEPAYAGTLADRERDLLAGALQASAPAAVEARWPQNTPERQPPPIPAPPSWHGPDDVEISDLPIGGYGQSPYAPPAASYGAPPRSHQVHDEFQPAPPAEVRRAPRRMPEVEDFPIVGQRDYYAKSSAGAASRGEAASHAAVPSHGDAAEPRRRGFFDRLTGRGKRESDSRSERADPHISAASKAPAHPRQMGPAEAPYAAPHHHGDEPAHRSEKPELPVFFSKTRR